MGRILRAISSFFDTQDFQYTPVAGQDALGCHYQGEHGLWHCVAWAREQQAEFVFDSIYSRRVPPEKRVAVMEYLTRINYGLFIGNFEIDLIDGEVRCKTSIDVETETLSPLLIRPVVFLNLSTMDKYVPGLHAIVEEDTTPQAALEDIEKD
jgi:hypothetical protein